MTPSNLNTICPLGRNSVSPYFVIEVQPTAESLTYGFSVSWNSGGYCHIIDWGDGTSGEAVNNSSTATTHTYSAPGTYQIRLQGNNIENFRPAHNIAYGAIAKDCNWNWLAVKGITWLRDLRNFLSIRTVLTELPETLTSCSFTMYAAGFVANISDIPKNVTNLNSAFNFAGNSTVHLTRLPSGVTSLYRAFRGMNSASFFDLNSIAANAPAGGWSGLTSLGGCWSDTGRSKYQSSVGSIATLMHKFPNVTDTGEGPFTALCTVAAVTLFGAADYFEITLTTTAANAVWGFTPNSNAGTWYLVDWGDNSETAAQQKNKSNYSFTSGSRIEHTFANAGTYHIKLAMNASAIAFDAYDSDNGAWDMIGNPTH